MFHGEESTDDWLESFRKVFKAMGKEEKKITLQKH